MPDFLDEHGKILKHGSDLPHWQQGEVMQFVTFRLGDSMPETKLRQWRELKQAWLAANPPPWTPDLLKEREHHSARTLERFLDEDAGSCIFVNPAVREALAETLMRDHDTRAVHHAWVIMPNHVHLLFTPVFPLDKLIQIWKGVSSRKIGRGGIWQSNFRDTLIRDWDHFASVVRYIRRNPRNLPEGTYSLWQEERALRVT